MLAIRMLEARFGASAAVEVDAPVPGPRDVLVAVQAVGICGSDLHAVAGEDGYHFMADRLPVTLGHEFAGIVVRAGDAVADIAVGDRVTCWPTVGCADCEACSAGRPQDCQGRTVIGLSRDGAMAEQVVVPAANCFALADDLGSAVAALAEPLSVAVHAVNVAACRQGDRVVVLGPGPIGVAIAWVAQQRGGAVLLAGLDDDVRLAAASDCGIGSVADLSAVTLSEAVQGRFGAPVDCVIEATGAAQSVADGLAVTRSSGTVVVAGIHKQTLPLNLIDFVRAKKQLRAAHDTTRAAFSEAIGLLNRHGASLEGLITHRLPLARADEGFALLRRKEAMKVLLLPDQAAQRGSRACV